MPDLNLYHSASFLLLILVKVKPIETLWIKKNPAGIVPVGSGGLSLALHRPSCAGGLRSIVKEKQAADTSIGPMSSHCCGKPLCQPLGKSKTTTDMIAKHGEKLQ